MDTENLAEISLTEERETFETEPLEQKKKTQKLIILALLLLATVVLLVVLGVSTGSNTTTSPRNEKGGKSKCNWESKLSSFL